MNLATDLRYWVSKKRRVLKSRYENLLHSPDAVIDAAVQKALGAPVVRKVQIRKGAINRVYATKLADGEEVIVRTSRGEKSFFQAERWAIEQCAKAGVPVPRVIFVGTTEHHGKPLNISIENKIHGTSLDELNLKNFSDEELANLLRKIGAILSGIHSVKTNGFGELDENGNGNHESIGDIFLQEHLDRDPFLNLARSISGNQEIVERAFRVLYDYSTKYPSVSAQLIHNDFVASHLLVDGNQITGVLDFEFAQGGDPVREFARWQFFWEDRFPLRYLLEGYNHGASFADDYEGRFYVWKVYTCLANLAWNVLQKDRRGIERCRERLAIDLS